MHAVHPKRIVKNRDCPTPIRDLSGDAFDALRRVETVARLLEATGPRLRAEPIEASLIADAAFLIIEQAENLRGHLEVLRSSVNGQG